MAALQHGFLFGQEDCPVAPAYPEPSGGVPDAGRKAVCRTSTLTARTFWLLAQPFQDESSLRWRAIQASVYRLKHSDIRR